MTRQVNGPKQSRGPEAGRGQGRVTIHDVAAMAGVSSATVSRVLNDSPLVTDKTRERVRRAIEKSGFHAPSRLARALRTNRTGLVGFMVENILNPYYTVLAREIDDAAKAADMTMLLSNDDSNEKVSLERIQVFGGLNVDGVIVAPWIGGGKRRDALRSLRAHGICVVGVGDLIAEDEFDVVAIDYRQASIDAVDHLLELGHRHIGFIGVSGDSDRVKGYRHQMETHSLPAPFLPIQGKVTTQELIHVLKDQLPEFIHEHGITAVVAHSDLFALGILHAAQILGLRIPEDLSVIGFDNVPQAEVCRPLITTVSLPYVDIARLAIRTIQQRLEERGVNNSVAPLQTKYVLPTKLIIRDSTAPPKD